MAGGTTTAGGTAGNSGGGPPGAGRGSAGRGGAGPDSAGRGSAGLDSAGRGGAEASPAAKLTGFLILLVLVFLAAYAAGARLGPVTTGHSRPGHSQPMNMNMGPRPGPPGPAGERGPPCARGDGRSAAGTGRRRDDVRLLRGAHRAPPEPPGRSQRDRQLRHRARLRHQHRRPGYRRADQRHRGHRVHRRGGPRAGSGRRSRDGPRRSAGGWRCADRSPWR